MYNKCSAAVRKTTVHFSSVQINKKERKRESDCRKTDNKGSRHLNKNTWYWKKNHLFCLLYTENKNTHIHSAHYIEKKGLWNSKPWRLIFEYLVQYFNFIFQVINTTLYYGSDAELLDLNLSKWHQSCLSGWQK